MRIQNALLLAQGQARGRTQDKSGRAARSAVFRENSKWWTKIYTRLTSVSRVKKVIQQFYWLITFFVLIEDKVI